jgi:hypothetical protein
LAVEAELRSAKEAISSLRWQLTKVQAEKEKRQLVLENTSEIIELQKDSSKLSNEEKALNYLILKYLQEQSFKLTAITFEEEV